MRTYSFLSSAGVLLAATLLPHCSDDTGLFALNEEDSGVPRVDGGGGSGGTGGSDASSDDGPDAGCSVDQSYMPSVDPNDFTVSIDNPYFPLTQGAKWVYESDEEVITVEVLHGTYTVAAGVECVVVHDEVRNLDGDLIEDTLDWYAQDSDGNVWYMGEDTAEYENGAVVSTAGSWEAGVDGAQPGVVMYGTIPAVGTEYRQEYYACEAEDMAEIYSLGGSYSNATDDYDECFTTRETTPLEPDVEEFKTYCAGVGLVLVEEDGEPKEHLTQVSWSAGDAGAGDGG